MRRLHLMVAALWLLLAWLVLLQPARSRLLGAYEVIHGSIDVRAADVASVVGEPAFTFELNGRMHWCWEEYIDSAVYREEHLLMVWRDRAGRSGIWYGRGLVSRRSIWDWTFF